MRIDPDSLRAAVREIVREHPLALVVLHGSAVHDRGEPEDLDLAVLPVGPIDAVELTNRFIRALRIQDVDLTDLSRADPLVLALVASEGIALHEAEPGEFARFQSLAFRRFADTRKFREQEREEIADFIERSS